MMSLLTLGLLGAATAVALPQMPQGIPAAMGEAQTGPFGAGVPTAAPKMSGAGGPNLTQILKDLQKMNKPDNSGGSGKYKSGLTATQPFDRHTFIAPLTLPPDVKLPVLLFGNGACSGDPTPFGKFLTEVASHGYFVIANGKLGGGISSSSKASDLPDAIEWVYKNAGQGPYATLDKTRIIASGQSCGGIQAYSASLDPRVNLTVILNSGLISEQNTPLFEKLHSPVGYFLGGPTDIAYENGMRDYKNLPAKIPSTVANLDVGHMGTYSDVQGGQFGKAVVAFLDWQLKGDSKAGELFLKPESSELTKAGWKIQSKGFKA